MKPIAIGKNRKIWMLMILFFALILIDIVTFSEARIEGFQNVLPIVVPYISVSEAVSLPIWLILFMVIYIYQLISSNGKQNIDLFGFFFVFRIIGGFLQIAYYFFTGQSDSLRYGNYFLWFLELIIYFVCANGFHKEMLPSYIRLIKIVAIVIAIETIWQSVLGVLPQVSYTSTWYKACMNIPIGSSNTLATMITPCTVAVLLGNKRLHMKDIAYFVLSAIAIFLTKSRFSMLILLFSFVIFLLHDFKHLNRSRQFLRVILILATFGFFVAFVARYMNDIYTVIYGFSDYVDGSVFNKLTSGRGSLITQYLGLFLNHPLIGNGPNYVYSRAHNIFLDLLYQNGIIGTGLFILAIVQTIKSSKKQKDDKEISFLRIYLVVAIIGAMGEISFFTARVSDLLFIPAVVFLNFYSKNKELPTMGPFYST